MMPICLNRPNRAVFLRFCRISCASGRDNADGGGCSVKKWLIGLFICAALLYNGSARGEGLYKAACLIEAGTGRVLYAYNADVQLPMASTTKVMTALLALENANLHEPVTCGKAAYGVPGTSIYLSLGESLAMEEMLTGMMLASGNDAAVAIAEHIGGSVAGFADMMNARALELGATGTNFTNPHGLPDTAHHTTARDLARIAREAMTYPVFRQIVSTQRASIPWEGRAYDRQLRNKNRLLSDYEGATGIKTGFTRAAGRCLVFGARRQGLEVIGVVLNCPNWFDDASALMDGAFQRFRQVTLLEPRDVVRVIPIDGGTYQTVGVQLLSALSAPLAEDEVPTLEVALPDRLSAPVAEGSRIGSIRLMGNGQVLCEQPLYAQHSVAVENIWNHLARVLDKWVLFS